MSVLAIYRNGVLEPQQPVAWRDGQRFRVEEEHVPSYLDIDRPMTEAEILAFEADMERVHATRMTDDEYFACERQRRSDKDEQIELLRKAWAEGKDG